MFGVRTCLLVSLVVGATSIATAEDYVLPTGVTVLTEEQILNQIIGNTLVYGYEHTLSILNLQPEIKRMEESKQRRHLWVATVAVGRLKRT